MAATAAVLKIFPKTFSKSAVAVLFAGIVVMTAVVVAAVAVAVVVVVVFIFAAVTSRGIAAAVAFESGAGLPHILTLQSGPNALADDDNGDGDGDDAVVGKLGKSEVNNFDNDDGVGNAVVTSTAGRLLGRMAT